MEENKMQNVAEKTSKSPSKSKKRQRTEQPEEIEKEMPKKPNNKAFPIGQSQRMRHLSNPAVVAKGNKPSLKYECEKKLKDIVEKRRLVEASSKDERFEKTFEKPQEEGKDEEVDHNDNKKRGKKRARYLKLFDIYSICFRLPNRETFQVITFDVYVTLGVPIGGWKIIEITKSSTDEEYDEVHAVWLKEWKINQNAPEITRMPKFILAKGDSLKRNFIIYSVNYFFNGSRKLILQQIRAKICEGCELNCIPRQVLVRFGQAYQHCEALQGDTDGVPTISECHDAVMKEAAAELHSACMEFTKLQAK
ncbi:LOW QUALITY PROTEIN: hypothetical protein Cgig2_011760 [Carnegiea gigantea]|uniref:Uncharacterized protein n=1 Tax=Carnegiea gigantea TaxID=171969 RepID=A0A9Q1JLW0_9CARY|nr:LOW QUALITY PROTEIN: hypothetical protein Cgig2_011760 [Carnegiea gigantea]